MDIKLNISKILLLDTPFKPEMLENNQAVLGEMEGETVLITKVNYHEVLDQVKKESEAK